ncbi:MAG: carboxypeptidase-like regulatory domain-containing protein [Terracidiphilus sp.]
MKRVLRMAGFGLAVFFGALNAHAGAPLKGIDVKLGKNPGGGSVQRTSDASGAADFGVLPKGSYVLTFSVANAPGAKMQTLHLEVRGSAEGTVAHVLPAAMTDIIVPVLVTSDGKTPVVIKVSDGTGEVVDRACCKSHSNTNNN